MGPEPSDLGCGPLQEYSRLLYKKEKGKFCMKMDINQEEVREENRKLRYLRFLVDFSILSIQQDDLLPGQAQELLEDAKKAACGLFPGKEETFELVYRPRFNRVIEEKYRSSL